MNSRSESVSRRNKKVTFLDQKPIPESLTRTATNDEPVVSGPPGSNLYGLSGYKASTFGPSSVHSLTPEEVAEYSDKPNNLVAIVDQIYKKEYKRLFNKYMIEYLGDENIAHGEALDELGGKKVFFERYQDALNDPNTKEEDKIWLDTLNKRYSNTGFNFCSKAGCVVVALGIALASLGYNYYFQGGKTRRKKGKRGRSKRRTTIKRSKKRRSTSKLSKRRSS